MAAATDAGAAAAGPPRSDWTTVRPARRFQPTLVAVGLFGLLSAAGSALLRLVPPTDDATALLAAFIPFGAVAALVALLASAVALLRGRRRGPLAVLTLLAAVLLGSHVTWQAPLYVADHRAATGPTLRVLSLNVYEGRADPGQVVAAAGVADLVVLAELTPLAQAALEQRGLRDRFPYTAATSGALPSDTAVYSRFPLSGSTRVGDPSVQIAATVVDVPGVGAVGLVAAHPCNPYCGGDRWALEHAALRQAVQDRLGAPLVVAGDLNAVDDHGPMLELRRLGLRSATDLLGAGWLPTYPAGRLVPPFLAIDHVLVDPQLTATSLRRVTVAGSDHLGLLATVARTR